MRRMKWLILSISKNKSLLDIPEFIKKTIQIKPKNTDEEKDIDFSLISKITEEIHKYYWKMNEHSNKKRLQGTINTLQQCERNTSERGGVNTEGKREPSPCHVLRRHSW